MIQVNILEQLKTLFEIFKNNSYVLILSIASILFLIILLFANKFKNKKITKIICILVYLVVFGTLIFFYHNEILKLLDYLMNNIFLFLFFPNLAVYALVLLIINFIIIKSTFSKDENKIVRFINVICFVLFNIIFYLIIDNVIKNKVDVYEQLSIYTNNDLLILIELSMKLFLLWLIILLIVKISKKLINYISVRKEKIKVVFSTENIQKELENVKVVPSNTLENVVEIKAEETIYNVYNDYVDIEPIKKKTNKFIDLEIDNNELNKIEEEYSIEVCEEEVNPLDTIFNQEKENVINQDSYINNNYEEKESLTKSVINDTNTLNNDVYEEIKEEYNPLTSFEIVDNYQSNNYLEIENEELNKDLYNDYYKEETKVENSMDLLFSSNNNYLKSIVDDIDKLKNNENDKNQIKKIYENIKLNQMDLTLNDYNKLIQMLLDIKK